MLNFKLVNIKGRLNSMENIKYQVFISSTYSDLVKERKQVLDILLMADCIPAGMENFVATDDEQFNVIKKVIDYCDYYILILGRRYGSVNEKEGISYTEMEYRYAIDKGIPVLVFALDDSVEIDSDKIETDVIKMGKLAEFKRKAMKNRLASLWKDQTDLMGKVAIAIMRAKSEIKRPGWHRGSDTEKESLLKQIEYLKQENETLRRKIESGDLDKNDGYFEKNFYGKKVTLHFTENSLYFAMGETIQRKTIEVGLDKLFKFVSLRITGVKQIHQFIDAVSSYEDGYEVDEQDGLFIRNKFEKLGLIESSLAKNDTEIIKLTDFGKRIMNELND